MLNPASGELAINLGDLTMNFVDLALQNILDSIHYNIDPIEIQWINLELPFWLYKIGMEQLIQLIPMTKHLRDVEPWL